MNLGGRLKLARENRGMTQEQLAEKASTSALPISQALISALEQRDSKTSTGLFAFAKVLNINAEWLQTGRGSSGLEIEEIQPVRRSGDALRQGPRLSKRPKTA